MYAKTNLTIFANVLREAGEDGLFAVDENGKKPRWELVARQIVTMLWEKGVQVEARVAGKPGQRGRTKRPPSASPLLPPDPLA